MASADRFGYEWRHYPDILPEHEMQFRGWVSPLRQEDFSDTRVLDAGCGMGRNSFWVAKWGAREVVAFDADPGTVEAASRNLVGLPNVRVLLKSIYDIAWRDEFDVVLSIGVIHHLENPLAAVRKLAQAVRPGGKVLIWVYGYEGNEWIVKFISPLRRVFLSRLPPALLDYLTYAVSIPFYGFLYIVPTAHSYLRQLKTLHFSHVHSIIFDQLLPAIARYYRREEAETLLREAGLVDVIATHVNNNSWAVVGVRPIAS